MTNQYKVLGLTSQEGNEYLKDFIKDNGFELTGMFDISSKNLDWILRADSDAIIMYSNSFDDTAQELVEKIIQDRDGVKIILLTETRNIAIHNKAARCGITKVLLNDKSQRELALIIEDVIGGNGKSEKMDLDNKNNNHVNEVSTNEVPLTPVTKKHKIISVYGTKGGTGKSTVSVNLATALQKNGNSVAIIDLDLQFGDVGVFMNVANVKTISDLVNEGDFGLNTIKRYMHKHSSGVSVLCAPESPELAEIVKPEHINMIANTIKGEFDYIVFDMSPTIDEYVLHVLDISDSIYFVTNPEISTLKNTKVCLNVLNTLGYSDKVKIVLNKDGDSYVKKKDMEDVLNKKMTIVIPRDAKSAISAINRGIPLVEANPHSKISKTIMKYVASEEI
jgi:pilus assembly protein CpaE